MYICKRNSNSIDTPTKVSCNKLQYNRTTTKQTYIAHVNKPVVF